MGQNWILSNPVDLCWAKLNFLSKNEFCYTKVNFVEQHWNLLTKLQMSHTASHSTFIAASHADAGPDQRISPSAAYMRLWTGPQLVQVMACRLFGAKPIPEPMLTFCQLDPWEQTSVKCESKYKSFHSWDCIWKCRLRNGGHFAEGEMSLSRFYMPKKVSMNNPFLDCRANVKVTGLLGDSGT